MRFACYVPSWWGNIFLIKKKVGFQKFGQVPQLMNATIYYHLYNGQSDFRKWKMLDGIAEKAIYGCVTTYVYKASACPPRY